MSIDPRILRPKTTEPAGRITAESGESLKTESGEYMVQE